MYIIVYSLCSDEVGLPLHNITSSEVLVKSIGADFLTTGALPGINHMRGIIHIMGISRKSKFTTISTYGSLE